MRTQLSIPEPCHADWNSMSEVEKGRFCLSCNKVVHDLTQNSATEINDLLANSSDSVCGRVNRQVLENTHLDGFAFQIFPMQRLRVFLLAFVMAFGLEVWGISAAHAQVAQTQIDSLKNTNQIKSLLKKRLPGIHVSGTVKDIFTQEEVGYASIVLSQNGKNIAATLSNLKGEFAFDIDEKELNGKTFDLTIRFMGRERKDEGIAIDVMQVAYLIDAGIEMDRVTIAESQYPELTGVVTSGALSIQKIGMIYNVNQNVKTLYRPLDEWLMMHSSEIHHNGRW